MLKPDFSTGSSRMIKDNGRCNEHAKGRRAEPAKPASSLSLKDMHFPQEKRSFLIVAGTLMILLGAGGWSSWAIADTLAGSRLDDGRQVYNSLCARCHGKQGQGTAEHFKDPLQGDLSVTELADLISQTMPEDEPDECVDENAQAVAEYIFDEFYSEAAQFKRDSTRAELLHRTVRQYQESVADLVGSFNRPFSIPDERGLAVSYYASSNRNDIRRLTDQTDPNIDFPEDMSGVPYFRADGHYEGVKEVKKENKMGDGFSAYWTGGIIAPETGNYEIVVHCRNGFKLWVNDPQTPLVDRWVRSDDELTHKASLYLLGGRPYFFRTDLFAFEDKKVDIQIQWKPPDGFLTTIPPGVFIKSGPDEVAVISTQFPADDASAGYKRGISISKQWDEATTAAAIEAASWVSKRIWKLAGTTETAADRQTKVQEFCRRFVERAFVNELTDEEGRFFVDQHFETDVSIADQVKRVVILTLKSPRFLYPEYQRRDTSRQTAQRLALLFWDSLPDQQLYEQLSQNQLSGDEAVLMQIERMLNESRSRQKLKEFFHQWLKMYAAAEASKDANEFPTFGEPIIHDLKQSLELYLDDVVWNDDSDYRQLYLADYLYVNSSLEKFYSFDLDSEATAESLANGEFVKAVIDPAHCAGILTHPYLMTGLAYDKDSSPIHRGVFVARKLIGRQLRPPPNKVKPLTDELGRELTTRERVEHQTSEAACMHCHRVINPLGFSLENFDAVGRFRIKDRDKPVNTTAVYETADGNSIKLNGPRDLAEFLANDETAQRSFIRQLLNHYTQQSVEAFGEHTMDQLHENFVANNYNIKLLLVDIARLTVK